LLAGFLETQIEGQSDLFHAIYFIAYGLFCQAYFSGSYAEFP
jgi:hypothetical protein